MLGELKNNIDFYLRKLIKISRTNYCENNESKINLDFTQEELELEKYLFDKYKLDHFKNNSSIVNYCQNLYTLYFLDKFLEVPNTTSLSVLDIGAKNWFYAQAEYSFFKHYCQNLELDGVEIDAYRLYSNLYNRYEVAKFYTRDLVGTNYIIDDVMNIKKNYDYIIWILPFVTIKPHRYWGLPDKYFRPNEMFKYAYSLLKNDGKMLIINQGDTEFEIQKNIASKYNITSSSLESPFYTYKNKRYISIIKKHA